MESGVYPLTRVEHQCRLDLYCLGYSDRAMARFLNVPRSVIWDWRIRVGLRCNPPHWMRLGLVIGSKTIESEQFKFNSVCYARLMNTGRIIEGRKIQ